LATFIQKTDCASFVASSSSPSFGIIFHRIVYIVDLLGFPTPGHGMRYYRAHVPSFIFNRPMVLLTAKKPPIIIMITLIEPWHDINCL
jgi:hypothetical protein